MEDEVAMVVDGVYPLSFILYLLFFVLGGATSQIGQNDHTNLGFSSLRQENQARPLRSETARGGAGSGT